MVAYNYILGMNKMLVPFADEINAGHVKKVYERQC
jgi:hypothetical protein